MSADDHLNGYQFYRTQGEGDDDKYVSAYHGHTLVGSMDVSSGTVAQVQVDEHHRRHGVATKMWEMAGKPKHSLDRTDAGDAWAHAVGGHIPPRIPWDNY